MRSDYKEYLAAEILSDDRAVTYRLLSRALKVHVNTAKEMLYEFHRQQNGKKPGSVQATYLISGYRHRQDPIIPRKGLVKVGEDEQMHSSPFRSSPVQQIDEDVEESPILSISLVKEEDLIEAQSSFESVASIHIYSLAHSSIKDLQILSDAARSILETCSTEDPLKVGKTYGTVFNAGVRRRARQRPQPASAPIIRANQANQPDLKLNKADMDDSSNASSFVGLSSQVKLGASSSQPPKDVQSKRPDEQKRAVSTPSQLRRDSSGIFRSFAKAKPKLKREGTDSSAGTSGIDSRVPSGHEDESMKDASEDEEDDYVPPPRASSKEVVETDRKSRKEREAALRKMMEDDGPEEDSLIEPESTDAEFTPADVIVSQPLEEAAQSVGGRRRGRKRVMKKRTIKDEEGYLVTKEEPVWESFSEDELVVVKPKLNSAAPGMEKVKKGPGKPGQGSIMSFFGKK